MFILKSTTFVGVPTKWASRDLKNVHQVEYTRYTSVFFGLICVYLSVTFSVTSCCLELPK